MQKAPSQGCFFFRRYAVWPKGTAHPACHARCPPIHVLKRYPNVLHRTLHTAIALACLLGVAACAMAPADSNSAQIVATVIVKPKAKLDQPHAVVEAVRKPLGAEAGVQYVRAMAGDAHIVYLTQPATAARVPALIERLRSSGVFDYVELDSMMKTQ